MLILHENIHCDPSFEPSQPDGSDEGSQHMGKMRNKLNNLSIVSKYSSYLELLIHVNRAMENIGTFTFLAHLYLYECTLSTVSVAALAAKSVIAKCFM